MFKKISDYLVNYSAIKMFYIITAFVILFSIFVSPILLYICIVYTILFNMIALADQGTILPFLPLFVLKLSGKLIKIDNEYGYDVYTLLSGDSVSVYLKTGWFFVVKEKKFLIHDMSDNDVKAKIQDIILRHYIYKREKSNLKKNNRDRVSVLKSKLNSK